MFDMKKTYVASVLTAAIASASMALMSSTPVAAQSSTAANAAAASAPSKPIPRTADGHPDMTGVWWPGHDLIPAQATAVYREGERQGIGAQSFGSLYKPEAMAKAKALSDKDDPALYCIPSIIGPTRSLATDWSARLSRRPRRWSSSSRPITASGSSRPMEGPIETTLYRSNHGDAVGHWEGDTLVVDVTNFSDRNWLHHHGDVSFHSDALHMVETYRLIGRRHARDQRHR